MQAKMGAPKAITVAAHKLARIFYRLWTNGNTIVKTLNNCSRIVQKTENGVV
jgi:hypothetical protein